MMMWLAMMLATVAADVLVCNSGNLAGQEFQRSMWLVYPNNRPLPCTMSYFDYESRYPGQAAYYDHTVHNDCDSVKWGKIDSDRTAGINVMIPWPDSLKPIGQKQDAADVDVTLQVVISSPTNDFFSRTASTTVWTQLHVDRVGETNQYPMQLPSSLVGGFTLTRTTVLFGAIPQSPDIVIDDAVQKTLARAQGDSWGIVTPGCSVPIITASVEWVQAGDCWKRIVHITGVSFRPATQCFFDTSTNILRLHLRTRSVADVIKDLKTNVYAVLETVCTHHLVSVVKDRHVNARVRRTPYTFPPHKRQPLWRARSPLEAWGGSGPDTTSPTLASARRAERRQRIS